MATLPSSLLATYQHEVETTGISIQALCKKYGVAEHQLGDYQNWKRPQPEIAAVEVVEQAPEKKQKRPKGLITQMVEVVEQLQNLPQIVEAEAPQHDMPQQDIMEDIEEFKRLAVKHAVRFIREDVAFADVKDFKDMVAVVDSIEKSYKNTPQQQQTTINIAVQNLVERFKDDC